jgi:hypothetical protein
MLTYADVCRRMLTYATQVASAKQRLEEGLPPTEDAGTQFTCFTGTKVQILKQRLEEGLPPTEDAGPQSACFTGTKVQILTQKMQSLLALLVQKYKY